MRIQSPALSSHRVPRPRPWGACEPRAASQRRAHHWNEIPRRIWPFGRRSDFSKIQDIDCELESHGGGVTADNNCAALLYIPDRRGCNDVCPRGDCRDDECAICIHGAPSCCALNGDDGSDEWRFGLSVNDLTSENAVVCVCSLEGEYQKQNQNAIASNHNVPHESNETGTIGLDKYRVGSSKGIWLAMYPTIEAIDVPSRPTKCTGGCQNQY